jgi:hypothetical protein
MVQSIDPNVLYLGISSSTWDSGMYYGRAANEWLLIALYVYDLVNAFDHLNTMLAIKCKLFKQFEMKYMNDLNEMNHILGIDLH